MLALHDVSYRYAGARKPALSGFSLEVGAGEVVGLVGASEAGKTTACLVASGLAPRAIRGTLTGALLLDGVDVAAWEMHRLVATIGIAFQNPATQLSGVCDTVFEEVCFGPMNLGLDRETVVTRAVSAFEILRIDHLAGRDPARLSGGEAQLVALAGLMALGGRCLVLDEPTAQLDPLGSRLVADALVTLAAGGTSILIAEQKTDLLARICSRIAAIEDGRIAFEGAAGAVLGDPRLPALGVAEPSDVRLRRLARDAALDPEAASALADAASAEASGQMR